MCGEARRSPASQFIHSPIAARRSSPAENRASGTGSGSAGKTGGAGGTAIAAARPGASHPGGFSHCEIVMPITRARKISNSVPSPG